MIFARSDAESLKIVLENMHNPEMLNSHPWVSSHFVQNAVKRNKNLCDEVPGQQLIFAVGELFLRMKPGSPPRRGKRLDTRWAEFGILAAQYFAPLQFGTPVPSSLRDAWGRMDHVILLYVDGRHDGVSSQEHAAESYKLIGDEKDVAPISTLSDWHRKGIQRLADTILTHEQYLAQQSRHRSSLPPSLAHSKRPKDHLITRWIPEKVSPQMRRIFLLIVPALIALSLILGGIKARRIYDLTLVVRQDAAQMQDLLKSDPGLEQITKVGPTLSLLRKDFDLLKDELTPVLWIGPWLEWVPIYGGDLTASRDLLELVDYLLQSAEKSYAAFQPLLAALDTEIKVNPPQIAALLDQAQPELTEAQQSLDRAAQLRDQLDLEQLSPDMRSVIEGDLDRIMPLMRDGLAIAIALPDFLGASREGPKTYLMLVQNEDELRPTGGFITAAGTLVLQNGEVLNIGFTDSGELDNWDQPYPQAPWQLERYMNSPVLLLRDSNWFTDFSTTALYAESLYAYQSGYSVDGVIAFDQHLLVMILQVLGPVEVEGELYPIDANNVIPFMRASKSPPPGQPVETDWSRKGFMDKITRAILARIFQGDDISWEQLGKALLQGLNEKHLLLAVDDPALGQVIARHGWDGALQAGPGDFLMVVDSNIGFNKTSAVVETGLIYNVNLTDVKKPVGQLTVTHRNNASDDVPCIQWGSPRPDGEKDYPIDACYWNYMRVYRTASTQLLDANPQSVPDEWMILDRGVSGQVDVLDEGIEGVQAFGTLMVVPGGESVITDFYFGLPTDVFAILPDFDWITYHLDIEKQPGTLAIPLTIRVHLPVGATLHSVPPDAIVQSNQILIQTDLRMDIDMEVVFGLK